MNVLSLNLLIILLILLILLSAFFSSSETGIMSINRYRLRHLARKDHKAAKRVQELLERPDRLLGVILIGNTFATVFASSVATILAIRFFGHFGVTAVTFIIALIIFIFAEITPKILAALYPERVAFPVSMPLKFLLKIFYPIVWLASEVANGLLRLFRVKNISRKIDLLSHEELHTIVHEVVGKSTTASHEMLLGVLDLSKATVEDIMIPRNEIIGIDLEDDWPKILTQLKNCEHTRLPIYQGSIDNVKGILHLRKALNLCANDQLSKQLLLTAAEEPYFIPEGTRLNKQLLYFQQQKIRIGLVVDEYGDILGLVTLEDILEEIVGQFTTDLTTTNKDIILQPDGSYIVNGSASIRELNRNLGWEFPTTGPKTLNGLIVEYLETIPSSGICIRIAGYPMEILEVEGNTIKATKIIPLLRSDEKQHV